ncbi:MAG: hypothetical protein ACRCTM_00295 [Sphaerotilus sulfidivorans]|uniref:hypothetical protein n=1 Tax=Sphaerotilus sulfidivorans TaxID=639200 RepID=UPI003F378287
MSAVAFNLDNLTCDDAAPLFRDPDQPVRLLALVAVVPGCWSNCRRRPAPLRFVRCGQT